MWKRRWFQLVALILSSCSHVPVEEASERNPASDRVCPVAFEALAHSSKVLFAPEVSVYSAVQFIRDVALIAQNSKDPLSHKVKAIFQQGWTRGAQFLPHLAIYSLTRPDLQLAEDDFLSEEDLWEEFIDEGDENEPIFILDVYGALNRAEHPTNHLIKSLETKKGKRFRVVSPKDEHGIEPAIENIVKANGRKIKKLIVLSHGRAGALTDVEGNEVPLASVIERLQKAKVAQNLEEDLHLLFSVCDLTRTRASQESLKQSVSQLFPEATVTTPKRIVQTGVAEKQASTTEALALRQVRNQNWEIPLSSVTRMYLYARFAYDVTAGRDRFGSKTNQVKPTKRDK